MADRFRGNDDSAIWSTLIHRGYEETRRSRSHAPPRARHRTACAQLAAKHMFAISKDDLEDDPRRRANLGAYLAQRIAEQPKRRLSRRARSPLAQVVEDMFTVGVAMNRSPLCHKKSDQPWAEPVEPQDSAVMDDDWPETRRRLAGRGQRQRRAGGFAGAGRRDDHKSGAFAAVCPAAWLNQRSVSRACQILAGF